MRLTSDHVLEAEQALNCIGDRELVLRNLGIPLIENLAVARDSFDAIDMSSNMISELGDGFPPFPRLSSLYLGSNRIAKIKHGVADSLPNLKVLILTSNLLSCVEDLNVKELARLSQLEVLSILDNPVADQPGVRQLLIQQIPTLTVVNFKKVSQAERKEAERMRHPGKGTKRKREANRGSKSKRPRVKVFDVDALPNDFTQTDTANATKRSDSRLTNEQSEALKKLIERAETIEQVTRIQEAIRSGKTSEVLETKKSAPKTPSKVS